MGRHPDHEPSRLIVLLMATILAACGGGASTTQAPVSTTPASASPVPTSAPTASPVPTSAPTVAPTIGATPANKTFPATAVAVRLSQGYDTSGAAYDPAKLGGLQPGDPIAYWYSDGTSYVLVYTSVDLAATGPLCPGNSIQTSSDFEHVSNAPTASGACAGIEATLAAAPIGVRICSNVASGFAYVSAIPIGAVGTLYASISKGHDGAVVGLTGAIAQAAVPEVDLDAMGCGPVVAP